MATYFTYWGSYFGNSDLDVGFNKQIAASATVLKGQPLTLAAIGKLGLSTVAQIVDYIWDDADTTSTSTSLTTGKVIPAGKGVVIWKAALNLITGASDVLCTVTGSTTTATFACTAGSSNDMIGGVIYLPYSDEPRLISANTYSGGNCTVTWIEPVAVAPTTATYIRVSCIGPGDKAVQLSATGGTAGGAVIADKTGGKLSVFRLKLSEKYGLFTFNAT